MENMFVLRSQREVVLRGSLLSPDHPGSTWVVFATPGDCQVCIHICWGSRHLGYRPCTPSPSPELIVPCLPGLSPSSLFSSAFPRFLLTAVALLSSYSIHLLLKSSGIVGEPQIWPVAGRSGLGRALLTVLVPFPHRHPCL